MGASYILNEKTAKRIGPKRVKPDYLQKLILIYNYFNILLSNSIAKNKIAIPNLNKTKTSEANLDQLIERKAYIAKLNDSLKSALADD